MVAPGAAKITGERVLRWASSSPANALINNLFWAGCVVGRYEWLWLVAPAVAGYVALLLRAQVISLSQLFLPIGLGVFIDSTLTAAGVFQFEHHYPFLPLWMATLWVAFSTTLPLSLRFLGKNSYLAALTGALGFPFSYYLGYKLGAVNFSVSLPVVLLMIALVWAVLLPVMYKWTNSRKVATNAFS